MLEKIRDNCKTVAVVGCASLLLGLGSYLPSVRAEETKPTEQVEKSPIELLIEQGDMYYNWGVDLQAKKDDRAPAYFSKALELYLNVYNGYGVDSVEFLDEKLCPSLYVCRQYDLGIKIFGKEIEEKPNDPILHNDLGALYNAKGMMKEAETEYLIAIKLDPNDVSAYYNLARLKCQQKKYKQSRFIVNKGLEINPEHKNLKGLLKYLNE